MSLLCSECNAPLVGSYAIFCFLGNEEMKLVPPKKSLVWQLVCGRHITRPLDRAGRSRLQKSDADTLAFAVVPGNYHTGTNFNGGFSVEQSQLLKKGGCFDQAVSLTGISARAMFPNCFKFVLTKASSWPTSLEIYKVAVEHYHTSLARWVSLVVEDALMNRKVSRSIFREIKAVGLIRPSTAFRSRELFPGESCILNYGFGAGSKSSGILGFDGNGKLISIDERDPVERRLYYDVDGKIPTWKNVT